MASSAVRNQLQERALRAENLLKLIRPRLEKLRGIAAAERCQSEVETLKSENDQLKAKVTALVSQLTALEKANGAYVSATSSVPKQMNDVGSVGEIQQQQHQKSQQTKEPADNGEKKPKSEKKQKTKAAIKKAEPASDKPVDVSRLMLKVGRIVDVKKHPDADSLYVESVDLAEERGPRTIVSGLVKHVPIEEMHNKLAVFMCNLKPAKMRGVLSEGMIMCASTPDKVQIISVPSGAVPGDKITFPDYPGEADELLNPKKKIWEAVQPDLKINEQGIATYKGSPFTIEGKGICEAPGCANFGIK